MQFKSNTEQKLNVQDIKDALSFFDALTDAVAIRLTALATANRQEFPVPPYPVGTTADPGFIDLIDKLCSIQEKMHCQLSMLGWAITDQEAQLIYELDEVIKTGHLNHQGREIGLVADRISIQQTLHDLTTNQYIAFEASTTGTIELFGTSISFGPGTLKAIGLPKMSRDELEEILKNMQDGETRQIEYHIVQGVAEYTNWLR
jgi:hypothetical protein